MGNGRMGVEEWENGSGRMGNGSRRMGEWEWKKGNENVKWEGIELENAKWE